MSVHLTLTSSRQGCYAHCSCGWRSTAYTTVTGAHVAFGEHLTSVHYPDAEVRP